MDIKHNFWFSGTVSYMSLSLPNIIIHRHGEIVASIYSSNIKNKLQMKTKQKTALNPTLYFMQQFCPVQKHFKIYLMILNSSVLLSYVNILLMSVLHEKHVLFSILYTGNKQKIKWPYLTGMTIKLTQIFIAKILLCKLTYHGCSLVLVI